ncbi:hypothetical protein BV96_01785 [Sphingomonas paucimobilis]|nr:hypothetical protein BV96_01785 [Sphingomonas paucimobilis]
MIDLQTAQRIAAAYPPEALHTPRWEREAYLTATQQLAWLIRFDPAAAAEALSATDTGDGAQIRGDRVRPRFAPHRQNHHG